MSIEEQLNTGTTIAAIKTGETEKAFKFDCEGDEIWVPKTQCRYDESKKELTLPDWLFKLKFPNG